MISCCESGSADRIGSRICSAMSCAAYLVFEVLPSVFPSCRALTWEMRSRSTPLFLNCESNSAANTTAAISPVGIRYNSLPRASFRSSWLLACSCWYNKAATGITGQARGSHPSMSSQTVDLLIVIMFSVTHPILVQIKTMHV